MRVREFEFDRANDLQAEFALHPAVARAVAAMQPEKQVDDLREFFSEKLAYLTAPDGMADRDLVAKRLAWACRERRHVHLFGDYDVDGTTSAAILADVLEALGAEVTVDTADRFSGGYGFSEEALARAVDVSPDLIVTCDCGSSDHERIEQAEGKGIPTLVIDHHLVPEAELPATAFLNPHRPECAYPFKGLCSAGLAFVVAAALRKELESAIDLRPWLDLVALGTIADVAPLKGDNRILTKAGLRLLSRQQTRPGLLALLRKNYFRAGAPIGGTDVGFKIAPRLNAPGRLKSARLTVELFRTQEPLRAAKIVDEIESLNRERRSLQEEATQDAIAAVQEIYGNDPASGIVVGSDSWHPGVVGIIAARLADRFHVPAIVISFDGRIGRGSARSIDGFDVHDAIFRSADELDGFGGHAAAAGVSLRADVLERFRSDFSQATEGVSHAERPEVIADAALDPEETLPSAQEIYSLEPVGEANRAPQFSVSGRVVSAKTLSEGLHLKLELEVGKQRLHAFGPNLGHQIDSIGENTTLVGELSTDHFHADGSTSLTFTELFEK